MKEGVRVWIGLNWNFRGPSGFAITVLAEAIPVCSPNYKCFIGKEIVMIVHTFRNFKEYFVILLKHMGN
jgi:hypothetical protein